MHSGMDELLVYRSEIQLQAGMLVRVPLGQRQVLGIVWDPAGPEPPDDWRGKVRDVGAAWSDLSPLGAAWRRLVTFAASYYQRPLGEVALAALPPQLRRLDATQLARRLKRKPLAGVTMVQPGSQTLPELTRAQHAAVQAILRAPSPCLLHGVTGSGKTEVYMRAAAAVMARDADAQVLVLVPEINLTPQLLDRFERRFGAERVVALHSGLTPARRLRAWLDAHTGRARVVLGTRVAVLASLPHLGLLVVDEEHDPSYKQQEGARYSARDLALVRGRQRGVPVVLGSATPSLESWWASTSPGEGGPGRYRRLSMPRRVDAADGETGLPPIHCVDMGKQPKGTLLAPELLQAVQQRAARGEQSLILLNRRGWAPVLVCDACGWKSECPHCSAYRVFHKIDRSLRCHHCGLAQPVPRACPACGNPDISTVGRGTEQLEERLETLLAGTTGVNGQSLRLLRMDADSTRGKGRLAESLAQVHSGEIDVLLGTQMIAKGHDFKRVTLVATLGTDGALFASDFRAPERLFALLMQAAGRAGRVATGRSGSAVWVQTWYPDHPLFGHLRTADYPGFARAQLAQRREAGLPPFMHLALLRAEAATQDAAQAFLQQGLARVEQAGRDDPRLAAAWARVRHYPAVPQPVQRVARVERAQLLLESANRPALQRVLYVCSRVFPDLRPRGARRIHRWAIDVDPVHF